MEQYRKQAHVGHKSKVQRLSGHSDEAADRSLVRKMVKTDALTGKARGGKAAKKIVPARPVPAPGVGAGPDGGRSPVTAPAGAVGLGAMGPKKGGKACRATGGKVTKHHFDAGAGSGEGRLEKIGRRI